jgi:hypothetical protein
MKIVEYDSVIMLMERLKFARRFGLFGQSFEGESGSSAKQQTWVGLPIPACPIMSRFSSHKLFQFPP